MLATVKRAFVICRKDTFEFLSNIQAPVTWTPCLHEAKLFGLDELKERGWHWPQVFFPGVENPMAACDFADPFVGEERYIGPETICANLIMLTIDREEI